MFKALKITLAVLLLTMLLFSCEKKVLEIVPVLQVAQDISIAGAKNINHFSFPSNETGYAADESPYIYKTTDGGQSWSKVSVGPGGNCAGIEFFDAMLGMALMGNTVYITQNGGQSWSRSLTADFIGTASNGVAVIGDCTDWSCSLWTSSNKGSTFQYAGDVAIQWGFRMARVTGTRVYIVGQSTDSNGEIRGLDLATRERLSLVFADMTVYSKISDVFENETLHIATGNVGNIYEKSNAFLLAYDEHGYDYHSVDGYQDRAIAVGDRTVSVNVDVNGGRRWSELLDANGNSFTQSFYKIRFVTHNSFYISGENGLLWRAKI